MPRRLPSSALDTQSQITAVSGSLASPQGTLSGYWKLDQKLTGNLQGNADTATKWSANVAINGTNVDGGTTPVTIGVNTTSITTSGTYYPTFVPTNVAGNQQASTHASLSYDPNTGYLSATRFVGSGAGLTGVVKSISFNGAAAVDGAVTINQSSYGLSAGTANGGIANIRLYSSSTAGATYTFSTSTSTSILRIVVGLGALDAGETALRAVFNATNPATGQPYGDLDGNGSVGTGDDSIIAAIAAGVGSATSRSNQLLAAIAASPDIGLIVRYGWINSSLANDVSFMGFNGTTVTRSGNTIIIASASPVAQVQTDWNATTGLGSILNKPTLFDGAYSSLSGIPAAPVTSVNGLTGAVTVRSVYNPRTTLYMIPERTVHNPLPLGYLASGYVGDYFSGHGFSLTGLTVSNFSSVASTDGDGFPVGWNVGFILDFNQAFFDTYAPGYRPEDLRSINVSMGGMTAGNGVYWTGQSPLSIWTTSSAATPAIIYTMNPNLTSMVARVGVGFTSGEWVFVNGRYSPASWPYALFLRIWVAE